MWVHYSLKVLLVWAFFFDWTLAVALNRGNGERSGKAETEEPAVIVNTSIGKIGGFVEESRDGKKFYSFKGIPYAEPPKRFSPAVPKKRITGDYYDARFERPECAQLNFPKMTGSEDCLYLSISQPHPLECPAEADNGALPVMVFIHGGGFKERNGSMYDGNYFVDACVVLVTFNYRLGALGFLTTGDGVIPGNLGLKDQLLALKWVQENIGNFRGNPDLVTIFGHSAGGGSVSHHVLSPASRGLFHRAISSSGATLTPWSLAHNPLRYTFKLAQLVGCYMRNSVELKKCLLKVDMRTVVLAQGVILPFLTPFGPVIEPPEEKEPFLTRNPYEILKSGEFTKVPYILGFVEEEGVEFMGQIFQIPILPPILSSSWSTFAPHIFIYDDLNMTSWEKSRITKGIRSFYFGTERSLARAKLESLASDRLISQGVYRTTELVSSHMPTYLYVNTFKEGLSSAHIKYGLERPVITHLDDEQYLFPMHHNEPVNIPEYDFSKDLIELWTNFAKFGKPTGRLTTITPWDSIQGRAYEKVYELSLQPGYKTNYREDEWRFWDKLGIYKYEDGLNKN